MAALLNDTEQITLAAALTLAVVQLIPLRLTADGATTFSETVFVTPFRVALTVTPLFAVTVPAFAVKLAPVPPAAMLTDAGTLSAEVALELSDTVVALVAAPLNDTEHVMLAPALTLAAVQKNSLRLTTAGATTLSEMVFVTPFSVALTVAILFAVTVPALAVKLALVPPAAMLTDAGTLSAEVAPELSDTVMALVAAPLNDTVQLTLAPALTLVAVQLIPLRLTAAGTTTLSETLFVTPFSVALTVALVFAGTVPAFAVKLALVPPAAMLTDAGTLSTDAALELSATVVAAAAVPLNETVQVTLAPEFTLAAPQLIPLRLTLAAGTTLSETLFVTPFSVAVIVALVFAVTVPAFAVKLALVPPAAMLTDAGTLSTDAALELSATVVAAAAVPLNETVQVTLAPELTLAVPQLIPLRLTLAAGTTLSETLFVTPFSVALTVALVFAVTVPAFAVKLALVPPAAMPTDAGTLSTDAGLELSATVVAAAAVPLNETVQVTLAPELTLAIPQMIPPRPTLTAGTTLSETLLENPFKIALTVTLVLPVTVEAVAVKPALTAPAAMVTDAGTLNAPLLELSVTVVAAGAAPLKDTVQATLPPELTLATAQLMPGTACAAASALTPRNDGPFGILREIGVRNMLLDPGIGLRPAAHPAGATGIVHVHITVICRGGKSDEAIIPLGAPASVIPGSYALHARHPHVVNISQILNPRPVGI